MNRFFPGFRVMYLLNITLTSLLLCATVSCGGTKGHAAHDHEHEGHDHESETRDLHGGEKEKSSDEILFPVEKARKSGIETEKVVRGPFSGVIPASGKVLPASGGEATVSATLAGEVRLLRHFNVGENVGAGTPLFSISSARLPEGDVARQAGVRLEKAKREYDRISSLMEKQLATNSELSEAKAELESARIASAAAGTPGGKNIAAPIAGYIMECLVRDGDFVEVGQPMMIITRDKRLQLRAEVSERDYDALPRIMSAKFRLASRPEIYDLGNLNGRVVSYGRSSGEDSPFIPVIFEFDNTSGIIPGAYAEIFLITSEGAEAISVPREALIEEQGVYSVFVRLDDDCYRKQTVTLGSTDGERTVITAGLKPGDEIVSKGAVTLKLASASSAIPAHSHEH